MLIHANVSITLVRALSLLPQMQRRPNRWHRLCRRAPRRLADHVACLEPLRLGLGLVAISLELLEHSRSDAGALIGGQLGTLLAAAAAGRVAGCHAADGALAGRCHRACSSQNGYGGDGPIWTGMPFWG